MADPSPERSPRFDDDLVGLDPDDPEAQAFAAHLDRMQRQGPTFTIEGYLDGVRTFADSANRAEGGRRWAAVALVGLLAGGRRLRGVRRAPVRRRHLAVNRPTLGRMETESAPKVVKSDAEWRAELTPAEYQVLRKAGTERPFVGEYTDTKTEGVYTCRACGAELFRSDAKFESHCGWPSFFTPLAGDAVIERVDTTLGMRRVEVVCANCHSHLGHVFEGEGYSTPTDLRYCINSISMRLVPKER